jgi:hypothetical protein
VDLSSCFHAARDSETTVLVRQRSQECHFYQCRLQSRDSRRIKSAQPLRWPAAQPVQRAGEEAAMPGQPARTRARFRMSPGNSPSRIASCHRRHRNHRSASQKSSHVFAEFTVRQNVTCRNRKTFRACAEAVDDESSLWKAEEIGGTIREKQERGRRGKVTKSS